MLRRAPSDRVTAWIAFARADGILSSLPIIDIDQQDVPAGDAAAVRVSHRQGANLKPSVYAIGPAATVFDVVGMSGLDGTRERGGDAREVIWMDSITERPSSQSSAVLPKYSSTC